MRVAGHFRYKQPPEWVYSVFTDPQAIRMATPGMRSLEFIDQDLYRAVLAIGIGGFEITWRGTLAVTDRDPGRGYRLQLEVQSHNGWGRADGRLRFLPDQDRGTRVEYDAEIELGGGQKLMPSIARGMVDFYLRGMAEALEEGERHAVAEIKTE